MEQLFSKLGYDVRQTLHHITGLLELVAEEPLSRNQSQYLSRCRTSADHLLRTANDLSLLISAETVVGAASTVSMRDCVAEIAELMQVLAARKGVDLTWTTEPCTPDSITVDSELIQDSLRRILDNAIRFSANGAVHLYTRMVSQTGEEALLVFDVSDTGPGIPADVRSDFESAAALPRSGGLGLSVVRRRVTAAGGHVSIVLSSAQGTTMRLSLPVRIPSEDQVPSDHTSSTDAALRVPVRSSVRLLVAEDSDDSYLLLQMYLKGTSYRISRALNGVQAVEMVKSGEYDLIMMDANMPVMDGYDATRTIREWETGRGAGRMPIVLISADDRAHQMRVGAMVGCSGYLAKPTTKVQVLEAIQFFTAKPSAGRH